MTVMIRMRHIRREGRFMPSKRVVNSRACQEEERMKRKKMRRGEEAVKDSRSGES